MADFTKTARIMSNESLREIALKIRKNRAWESAIAKLELERRDAIEAIGIDEASRFGWV